MKTVLLLLLPPLLIFALALVILLVPLPPLFPEPLSKARNLIAVVGVGILGLGYLLSIGAYAISILRESGRRFDPIFPPGQFSSDAHLIFGRRYRGLVSGFPVEINHLPGRGIQPGLMNIYLRAKLEVRAAISPGKPLLDCQECPLLTVQSNPQSSYNLYTREQEWGRNFFNQPTVKACLSRIFLDLPASGFRELYLQPDRLWLRARLPNQVSAHLVEQWLQDCSKLVECIVDLPE